MAVIENFQTRIGATPDGEFGKETMLKAIEYYKISKEQAAHFFGQCYHETGGFNLFTENLNYSTDSLLRVFGKYFPTRIFAMSYAKKPEKIANRVYGNRMGNGDEASGDGWKYRGRGALQLTGKDNYEAFAEYLNDDAVVDYPELVATKYAFDSALYYFKRNNLWKHCLKVDDQSILIVSKKINGGTNGLAHRVEITKKFYNMIK